jgi:thioredoxin 2
MESVLAHIARKERGGLRIIRVDVDEQAELAEKFEIDEVPTLVLVQGGKTVGRIEGRASAPRIERLLASHAQTARSATA